MPEPIDRLFVDIVANMEPFLDSLEEGIKKGIDVSEEGGKKTASAYRDSFIEPMKEMLKEVEEAQRAAFGGQVDIRGMANIEGRLKNIINLGVQQGRSTEDIMSNMTRATDEYSGSLKQTSGLTDLVGLASRKLGVDIVGLVAKFGTAIGVIGLAAGALKEFVDLVKESVVIALVYEKSQFRLAREINKFRIAAQDSSMTMELVNEQLAELSERFGIGELEGQRLVSTALRMAKEFGLTAEQVLDLTTSAAGLAPSLDEVDSALFRIAMFMQTGMPRMLAPLGIIIDEIDMANTAWELGIRNVGDAMTDEEKRLVRYTILTEEAAKLLGDAEKEADTFAQRIKSAGIAVEEAKADFGDFFAPVKAGFAEIGSAIQVFVIDLFVKGTKAVITWSASFIAVMQAIADTIDKASAAWKTGGWEAAQAELDNFVENLKVRAEESETILEEYFAALATGGEKVEEVLVPSLDAAAESWEDYQLRFYAVAEGLKKELDDLAIQIEQQTAQIEQAFKDALADIERDFARRRIDAAIDLEADLADIDQQAEEARLEAIIDAQVEERRIIEDHQRVLIDLEQQYLMNLEDAVRERDARQVLLLQRRYNVERGQLESDVEIRLQRLREDFQLQLAEIERQRQIRRAERIEAFNEEMADLAIQEERRRQDAQDDYKRALRDLDQSIRDRRELLLNSLINEETITKQHLDNILALFRQYMGQGGAIEQIYAYAASLPGMYPIGPSGGGAGAFGGGLEGPAVNYLGGYQRGGSMIATSPGLIKVGEVPERVDITPLSAATGTPKAGGGPSGGQREGSVQIAIDLSEGLEGEIIDQTMGEMAGIFVKLSKGQKRASR